VLPARLVTPVPLAPAYVLGVLRHEGNLIAALSLASLLERSWRTDPSLLIVLERGPDALLAVECGEAPQTVAVARDAIVRASPDARGLRTIERPDGAPLKLIDVDALLETLSPRSRLG
jgi:chemotaxis signal transduction protein